MHDLDGAPTTTGRRTSSGSSMPRSIAHDPTSGRWCTATRLRDPIRRVDHPRCGSSSSPHRGWSDSRTATSPWVVPLPSRWAALRSHSCVATARSRSPTRSRSRSTCRLNRKNAALVRHARHPDEVEYPTEGRGSGGGGDQRGSGTPRVGILGRARTRPSPRGWSSSGSAPRRPRTQTCSDRWRGCCASPPRPQRRRTASS